MPWAVVFGDGLALRVGGLDVAAEGKGEVAAGVGEAGAAVGVAEGGGVVGAGEAIPARFPPVSGVGRWRASTSTAPATRTRLATMTAGFSRLGGMGMAGLRDYPAAPEAAAGAKLSL